MEIDKWKLNEKVCSPGDWPSDIIASHFVNLIELTEVAGQNPLNVIITAIVKSMLI